MRLSTQRAPRKLPSRRVTRVESFVSASQAAQVRAKAARTLRARFYAVERFAGAFANTVVAQPIDTCKVKLQLFPRLYTNVLDCALRIGRTEGARGLYVGFTPALTARLVENIVVFAVYDYAKQASDLYDDFKLTIFAQFS